MGILGLITDPKLGFQGEPSMGLRLGASYGRSFQARASHSKLARVSGSVFCVFSPRPELSPAGRYDDYSDFGNP